LKIKKKVREKKILMSSVKAIEVELTDDAGYGGVPVCCRPIYDYDPKRHYNIDGEDQIIIILPGDNLVVYENSFSSSYSTSESGIYTNYHLEIEEKEEETETGDDYVGCGDFLEFKESERMSFSDILIEHIGVKDDPNCIYNPEEEVLDFEYIFMDNIQNLPKFFGHTK